MIILRFFVCYHIIACIFFSQDTLYLKFKAGHFCRPNYVFANDFQKTDGLLSCVTIKLLLACRYFSANISRSESVKVFAFYSFVAATSFQVFLGDELCQRVISSECRRLLPSVEVTYRKYIAALEIKTSPSRPVLLTKTTEPSRE
jgi:hypothetical protein